MQEGKKRVQLSLSTGLAVVLMGLAVAAVVLLALGLLGAVLTVKGVLKPDSLNRLANVSLFLAALLGGGFAARKMKRQPLLWTAAVAVLLVAVCLLSGVLAYGVSDASVLIQRSCAGLLGGLAAGMLRALRRK